MWTDGPEQYSRYSDGPGIESRGDGEIFRTHPDWLWGPPSLLYHGYRVFLPGSGFDHQTPYSAEVKESVQLNL